MKFLHADFHALPKLRGRDDEQQSIKNIEN